MYILGLTGAMASGKSTTAALFRRLNIPVFCADRAVHRLLAQDPVVIRAILDRWPQALDHGRVVRPALLNALNHHYPALFELERILFHHLSLKIHRFLRLHLQRRTPLVVLDLPLLFEVGFDRYCDSVAVVTLLEHRRRARLLRRPSSSQALAFMEGAQLLPAQREKMADFVLVSGGGLPSMLRQIQQLMDGILGNDEDFPRRWSPARPPLMERLYDARDRS